MTSKQRGGTKKKEEPKLICEICGEEVDKLYTCKECDTAFCADCGDPKKRLCMYCLEEEDEPL